MSSFAERLNQREFLLGTMLTLPSPEIAEMISKCGFDWLFLDGEHGPATELDWQRVMQAVGGRCACVLRVPTCSEVCIKKALDIGADGIIVPMVNSAEQAREAVAWTRYPPQGKRGIGLARAHGYGLTFSHYLERANDDIALILQAEHIDAANNIDAITEVDGIDAIFVGPYDLSASMGKTGQLQDAEVRRAIVRVTEACKERDLPLGYFGVTAESVMPLVDQGYSLVCAGTDADLVTRGAQQIVAEMKAGTKGTN
ncbi:MAG: HpcH/HpaI aldolase family protein [Woeseiaceae bacterium]